MPFTLPPKVPVSTVNFSVNMVLVSAPDDEEGYPVPLTAKRHSDFLSNLIPDDSDDRNIIAVNELHTEVVRAVAAYLTYYSDAIRQPKASTIPKPCPSQKLIPEEWLDTYEIEFCRALLSPLGEADFRFHTSLIHAANFLNIKDLLLLTCCCWAMRLKGKTLDGIKELTQNQTPIKMHDRFELKTNC
jgi:S-phase kinase-associated protein 1